MNCIIAILKRMFLRVSLYFLSSEKLVQFTIDKEALLKMMIVLMQWFLQKSSFRKYDFFNGDVRLSCTCISEDRNVNIFWTGFFLVRN